MDLTRQTDPTTRDSQTARFALTRILVLFLLCAVPVLSTIAKDNIYLPQSNHAHFVNIASKMKVADVSVVIVEPQTAEPLAAITLPQPEIRVTRPDQLEAPPVARVSLTVCLQHRSPPLNLA
jgi:hypothetical protein